MDRKIIRDEMMKAVNVQLAENSPPEVKQTLDRLISEGWSKKDAKSMIAQCLIVEIFDIGKHHRPHDPERYIANLNRLPEEPFEEPLEEEENDADFKATPINKTQDLPTSIKIGRNQKVTVKYSDGRIEENIKFKKVKGDLLDGLCELVD